MICSEPTQILGMELINQTKEKKNTPTCAVWNVLWEPVIEVETSRPDIWITTTDPSRRGAVGLQHQSDFERPPSGFTSVRRKMFVPISYTAGVNQS